VPFGALPAGVNAIVDALSVYGISHIDTPCRPYRVWQTIEAARQGAARASPALSTLHTSNAWAFV